MGRPSFRAPKTAYDIDERERAPEEQQWLR
jgi:hypothetical protein